MKNNHFYITLKPGLRWTIFISLIAGALLFHTNFAMAQEEKDSASLPAGKPGKLSFTMNLSPMVSNDQRSLKVKVSRKENKKTLPVDNLTSPLILYLNEEKEYDSTNGTGRIGKSYLNNEGEGIFEFPSNFNTLTSGLHVYTFIVKMDADPLFEDIREEITIADAKIILEYAGADSIKTALARLTVWKDSTYVPLSGAELKLCIKRTFNFLPFGEAAATTNETGEISGELPLDIPGNANGTLIIAARLENDETYGTVEVTSVVPWAVLPRINPLRGRTLWSSGDNAPLLLVISSVLIIIIIWGTIFYLVYLLFKIKKLSKSP